MLNRLPLLSSDPGGVRKPTFRSPWHGDPSGDSVLDQAGIGGKGRGQPDRAGLGGFNAEGMGGEGGKGGFPGF